ncbi:hypothetical protein GCM10010441_58810 [Kitasatospora paracochleata]
MAHFEGESGAAGVQPAVDDEGAADAAVAGGDQQQVPGAASGAVPVLGERGQVGVVGDGGGEGGTGLRAQVGLADLLGEQVGHRCAAGPAEVEGGERGAVGFGDRVGQGQPDAEAAAARAAGESGTGLGDRAQQPDRVGGGGKRQVERFEELSAEGGERDADAVGVDLGGDHHRAVLGEREAVRGPAAAAAGRAGVDGDQSERLEFAGDRTGGGAGDVEGAGERRAGGRLAGVDQLQGRTEQGAAPVGRGSAHGIRAAHSIRLAYSIRAARGVGPGVRA